MYLLGNIIIPVIIHAKREQFYALLIEYLFHRQNVYKEGYPFSYSCCREPYLI